MRAVAGQPSNARGAVRQPSRCTTPRGARCDGLPRQSRRSRRPVSWLPDRSPAGPSQVPKSPSVAQWMPFSRTALTFVPGYSGGGRVGVAPTSRARTDVNPSVQRLRLREVGGADFRRSAYQIELSASTGPASKGQDVRGKSCRHATHAPARGHFSQASKISSCCVDTVNPRVFSRRIPLIGRYGPRDDPRQVSTTTRTRFTGQRSVRNPAEPWQGGHGRGVPCL